MFGTNRGSCCYLFGTNCAARYSARPRRLPPPGQHIAWRAEDPAALDIENGRGHLDPVRAGI